VVPAGVAAGPLPALADLRLKVAIVTEGSRCNQDRGNATLVSGDGAVVTVTGVTRSVRLEGLNAGSWQGTYARANSGGELWFQLPVRLVTGPRPGPVGVLLVRTNGGGQQGVLGGTANWADSRDLDDLLPERRGWREGFNADVGYPSPAAAASIRPELPSNEGETDYYSDGDWSNWVGAYIRLCDGAVVREGVQDGNSKSHYRASWSTGSSETTCWQKVCDGTVCNWFQVACPGWFCSPADPRCGQ
jgi:hypothetical protein